MKSEEILVFSVRMEREKLAKDMKSIVTIFSLLEEENISCECVAVNIDWICVMIRETAHERLFGYLQKVANTLSGVNISVEENIVLLELEEENFDCRTVGLLMSSLSMNQIDVKILRETQKKHKLVIGLRKEEVKSALNIVTDTMNSSKKGSFQKRR